MSEAQRFRERASECRALAKNARSKDDAALLEGIADEMDAEAEKLEAEDVQRATASRH